MLVDAAQAAIEKAMAARTTEATLSPREKAQVQLDKLQQRLQKSQDTLARSRETGEEDKIIAALELSIARLGEKISAARSRLNEAENA